MVQAVVSNPAEPRWAMLEALGKIKGHYHFELAKAREWYGCQDQELEAYHRGKARGLLFAIDTIEAVESDLKTADVPNLEEREAVPLQDRIGSRAGVA
jgi:hypothetical protein